MKPTVSALEIKYDISQREYDRAIEAYNHVYDRINIAMVLVVALVGFTFSVPAQGAFIWSETNDPAAVVAKCFFGPCIGCYSVVIVGFITLMADKGTFHARPNRDSKDAGPEEAVLSDEINRLRNVTSYYDEWTKGVQNVFSSLVGYILVGMFSYIGYWMAVAAIPNGGGV